MRLAHPHGGYPIGPLPPEAEERFRDSVMVTDSCHVWMGTFGSAGHGRFSLKKRGLGAHRVAYMLAHGVDPVGYVVRHKCDNPLCVAPYHLEIGTQADNVHDAFERGQLDNRGAKSPMHRLGKGRFDEEKVRDVRRRVAAGESMGSVGRLYGTSAGHIQSIRDGKKWGWVQ